MLRVVVLWMYCCVVSTVWASSFISDSKLHHQILHSANTSDARNVSATQRSLVVYRLKEITGDESLDVVENNIKIFSAAVQSHSATASHQAFTFSVSSE